MVKLCPLTLLLSVTLAFALPCKAQTRTVNGMVFTMDDLPVGNIEIVAKKSGESTKSDSTGSFTIECADKDVLLFKGKVFEQHQVKIKGETGRLEVELTFINTEENRQYAINYGYITNKEKLDSAAEIPERNEFCSYLNIFDAIEKKFPIVQVNDGCVVIRGVTNSFQNNCALFVVDGRIMPSISGIFPCMVKSIDIIKDGTSAIYGLQGANGVIIIETIK